MIRKSLTILSLVGLVMSLGLSYSSLVGITVYSNQIGQPVNWTPDASKVYTTVELSFGSLWVQRNTLTYSVPALYEIPLWIPTVVFAVPIYFLLAPVYLRRKRRKLGLCVNCGYDLHGATDRCPECHTAIER